MCSASEEIKPSTQKKQALTLVAQDSAPIHVAYALPWSTVAVSVFASRIRHALIAKFALPSFPASNREKTRRFFVNMHVITFVFITLHTTKCATDVFFERKHGFRRPSVNKTRVSRECREWKKERSIECRERKIDENKTNLHRRSGRLDFERWSKFSDNSFVHVTGYTWPALVRKIRRI